MGKFMHTSVYVHNFKIVSLDRCQQHIKLLLIYLFYKVIIVQYIKLYKHNFFNNTISN